MISKFEANEKEKNNMYESNQITYDFFSLVIGVVGGICVNTSDYIGFACTLFRLTLDLSL